MWLRVMRRCGTKSPRDDKNVASCGMTVSIILQSAQNRNNQEQNNPRFYLGHVGVFRAIFLAGSISTAAELLYQSQPNVSKPIAELGDCVGFRLFMRRRRGMVPTLEERRLHQAVENAYDSIDENLHLHRRRRGICLRRLAWMPHAGDRLMARSEYRLNTASSFTRRNG